MNTSKKYILIIVTVLIIFSAVYLYFTHKKTSFKPTQNTISTATSTTTDVTDNKIAQKATIESLAVDQNNYKGAIHASDDYLAKYGDDLDVWIHRSMSYYQLNDCANAIISLNHAVQMSTSSDAMSIKDVDDLYSSMVNSDKCKK